MDWAEGFRVERGWGGGDGLAGDEVAGDEVAGDGVEEVWVERLWRRKPNQSGIWRAKVSATPRLRRAKYGGMWTAKVTEARVRKLRRSLVNLWGRGRR